MHKTYDKKFKHKVALEAIKEEKTLADISSQYGVPSNRISICKKEAMSCLSDAFKKKSKSKKNEDEEITRDDLLKEIGPLKVENVFLKKKSPPLMEAVTI